MKGTMSESQATVRWSHDEIYSWTIVRPLVSRIRWQISFCAVVAVARLIVRELQVYSLRSRLFGCSVIFTGDG